MSVSDPRRVVVQATNLTGQTLVAGAVLHVANSNSSVVADPPLRYAMTRNSGGGTTQGRAIPTVGVVTSERPTADGETMSVCIQGACFAFCDANSANIDSSAYLYVSDVDQGGVARTLTNNPGRSANMDNTGGNTALDPGTGAINATAWITAIRARASDPRGGPASDGVNLLADGNAALLPVIILNNPGTNAE